MSKKRLIYFSKVEGYKKDITYGITTDKHRSYELTLCFGKEGDLLKAVNSKDVKKWIKSSLISAFNNFKLKVEKEESFKPIFNLEYSFTGEVVLCKNGNFELGRKQFNIPYTAEEIIFLSRILWNIDRLLVS